MHFDDVEGRLPASLWRVFKLGLWAMRNAIIGEGAYAALRSEAALIELRDRRRKRTRAKIPELAILKASSALY